MWGATNNELRQKLINLMYIVFITLAFIYLPSEFVDSAKYTSLSLMQTGDEYEKKVNERTGMLEEQLYLNSPLAQDYANVMDVSENIDSANAHIGKMIAVLQNGAGGYNENNYLTGSKNFLISNRLLVKQGHATELKEEIETIKQKIHMYNLTGIIHNLDSLLPTSINLVGSSGKERSWELFFFSKAPAAIAVTNLYKIRSDLLYAKHKMVEYLVVNLSKNKSDKSVSILSSNSIAVEMLATKNYFVGQKIAFRVIMLDSTGGYSGMKAYVKHKGKIIKELTIGENGMIEYTPNKPGDYQIVVVNNRETSVQNFVVTNLRTAFSEKNRPEVLFLGIDNPIQVQATEFTPSSLQLEIDMGEVIPFKEKYYLRFNKEGLAHLKIYATNEEGRYLVTERTYEVKKLPEPKIMLDGRAGGSISKKILQVQETITAGAEGITAEENVFNILSFEIIKVTNLGKESVTNRGKDFSSEVRKLIRDLKTGDLLVIDNVKIEATDGTLKDVAPIVFSVK